MEPAGVSGTQIWEPFPLGEVAYSSSPRLGRGAGRGMGRSPAGAPGAVAGAGMGEDFRGWQRAAWVGVGWGWGQRRSTKLGNLDKKEHGQ